MTKASWIHVALPELIFIAMYFVLCSNNLKYSKLGCLLFHLYCAVPTKGPPFYILGRKRELTSRYQSSAAA
jgi:hypothetical protein